MSLFNPNPRPADSSNRGARPAETPSTGRVDDVASQDDDVRAGMSPFMERNAPVTGAGPTDADKCSNVIATGSRWSGTLKIDDSVRIEGQLSGEVDAKGTVHIAEGARVEAKVRAAFVVISGSFKGEVRCTERLELMPRSRVEGQLVTKVLNVHEGAIVDGTIQMQNRDTLAEGETAAPREESRSRSNGRASAPA